MQDVPGDRVEQSSRRKEAFIRVDAPIRTEMRSRRPRLVDAGGVTVPEAPGGLDEVGIPPEFLSDLVLKTVHLAPHFTTDWVVEHTLLSRSISADLLEQLMMDRLVEVVGQDGPLAYRWSITDRGRERATRLLGLCGYIGPAPVSLDTYNAMLEWQCDHLPVTTPRDIKRVTAALVLSDEVVEIAGLAALSLSDEVVEIAGLAALSRRSLFLYGPPGNGKTTIGHLLHDSLAGDLWVPHSIVVGNDVIRVYDPHVHEADPPDLSPDEQSRVDRRWVRVRRPFVVAAGELQIEDLDLAYSQGLGYYEAPLHMKANGGIFMLDDFGYQRANPFQLLNRWVFPLEHGVDFLTLKHGQKMFVPFRQMLVVSTNLDPETVMEPAILRRIGYRLHLGPPTANQYAEIFRRLAEHEGLTISNKLIHDLLERHHRENRPLAGCVPRDLIVRARDICKFRGEPMRLDEGILDTAWRGYFGNQPIDDADNWR